MRHRELAHDGNPRRSRARRALKGARASSRTSCSSSNLSFRIRVIISFPTGAKYIINRQRIVRRFPTPELHEKLAISFDIIRAQMSKFDDEEFDFVEYEREQQKRRKRFAVGLIIVSIVVLVGMVIFWH